MTRELSKSIEQAFEEMARRPVPDETVSLMRITGMREQADQQADSDTHDRFCLLFAGVNTIDYSGQVK